MSLRVACTFSVITNMSPSEDSQQKPIRITSEFAGCILGEHTAEQLQQLLFQQSLKAGRVLYFEIIFIKVLFCDLLHPEK